MAFVTDKQTQADLNLLGKYKTGSMFNLFNQVKTRGGELLLEDMFRAPFTDAGSINQRAVRIQYLQQAGVQLGINTEIAELASQYLTENHPAGRLSSLFTVYREKSREVLYRSDKYHLHQRHIYAVQEILLAASNLLGQLRKKEKADNPVAGMQQELEAIVNAPALKQLKAKFPYTLQQTAECHYLFLNKCRQQLEALLKLLYEFDVYISVAQVAAAKGLRFAVAENGDGDLLMRVTNLRHPALPQAVGNNLALTRNANMLFLTGANMAGKSTWMKTLGLSFYLAHMGFPVAGDAMHFAVMEGIFTSINVPDDISQGWSHFYAEVMRVKRVAEEVGSGKKLFILFDELFKGTNVKDAYDATLVVTQKLAAYRTCAFVVSTHIIEVGTALQEMCRNLQFAYMPTVMEGVRPRYTYRLEEGITSDRQGMMIIENEHIIEIITDQEATDLTGFACDANKTCQV